MRTFVYRRCYAVPSHIVELANNRFYQLVGNRRDHPVNKPIRAAMPEVESSGVYQAVLDDRVYATGAIRSCGPGRAASCCSGRCANRPMEEHFLDFVYQPEPRGWRKDHRCMLVHGVEVTQRKMAELAMGRTAEHRRLALESAEHGLVALQH